MNNDELLNKISKYEVFKDYVTYISPLGKVQTTLLTDFRFQIGWYLAFLHEKGIKVVNHPDCIAAVVTGMKHYESLALCYTITIFTSTDLMENYRQFIYDAFTLLNDINTRTKPPY